jgi:hypothetical protein
LLVAGFDCEDIYQHHWTVVFGMLSHLITYPAAKYGAGVSAARFTAFYGEKSIMDMYRQPAEGRRIAEAPEVELRSECNDRSRGSRYAM